MSWQSCHLCPFQAHLSSLPLGPTCETVLSKMSFPGCPVPAVLSDWSCPRCHIPNVLSQLAQLFHPGRPIVAGCPVPDIFFQRCGCTIPVVLSYCPVLAAIFWPFCLCFLSWLYYPVSLSNFPVPVLLSLLSCSGCPVPAVLSWLSCPSCPIPAVLPGCSVTAVPSPLSCPCCPLPAVLF
jgi:hypothetical protein